MSRNRKISLVTIAIPTYNRVDTYLPQTLKSALAQTYTNLQIIVADNGSTDGTEAFVRSLEDSRIRYIRHPRNIRPNDNFNFCLRQARGKYFQLLHDDDTIDTDFIEACLQAVGTTEVGLIRTGARIIDAKGAVIRELPNRLGDQRVDELFLSWLQNGTWMFLCATLFDTSRLREIGGFNSKHQLFQDVLAEFKLAARYGRADASEVKASFRKHEGQGTVAAKVHQWCEDSLVLLGAMCEMAPRRREEIWLAGLEHFSSHNYDLATLISNPMERYRTYWLIYRMFDRAYSPIRFLREDARRRVFARLGRIKRALLAR